MQRWHLEGALPDWTAEALATPIVQFQEGTFRVNTRYPLAVRKSGPASYQPTALLSGQTVEGCCHGAARRNGDFVSPDFGKQAYHAGN